MIRTFVTVGNARQPFSRLLDAVAAVAGSLPGPVLVQRGHTPFGCAGMEVVDFVAMDRFSDWVAQADVLIMHAGAGSVIQAVRAGKAPIVMPRRAMLGEHVNDHQVEFAHALEVAGKVRVAEDAEGLRRALASLPGVAGPGMGQPGCMDNVEPPMVERMRQILRELDKELN